MSKVTVKVNYAAVGKLLKSNEIKEFDESIAMQVVNRAGEGYDFSTHDSGQRYITNIYPTTREAVTDNFDNNTLVRSLR